jgi:ubiquinone/menaquinone biosynthesis C-methylase UbiE
MKLVERIDIKNLTLIDIIRYKFASKYVEDKIVLDIACGSGYGTILLSEHGARKVIGLDIDFNTILELQKQYHNNNNNIEFINGSTYSIPFSDEYFDILVSIETLEHLENPDTFLNEARRVLKKGGIIIISTPLNESESRFTPQNPFHIREYNLYEIECIMSKYFIKLDIYFQRSKLKANWLTRIFDRLRRYGVNLTPLKSILNPILLLKIRKILKAQKSKIISSEISEENNNAEVVIVVGRKY